MNTKAKRAVVLGVLAVAASLSIAALAQVRVDDAWVRGTVPAQRATGAFMKLTSPTDASLVGAASPVAAQVEIHESSMQGGVMQMRAVPRVALPASKPVELKPGGYHIMLMGLTGEVRAGADVPIALTIESRDGTRSVVNIVARARALTDAGHGSKH